MNPNGFVPGQYLQPVVGAAYYHYGQPLVPPQPLGGMPMHNPPQNILVPQPIQQPLPQNMLPPQPMMQAYPQWQGWQPNGAYGIPVPQLQAQAILPQAPLGWIPQAMPAPVQFQPIAVGYPQPQAPRVPVQDLGVAAPAERLRPYLRGDRDASKVKEEKTLLSSDDEKVLVDALKAGKAQGLTMGEVVNRLQKSNADVGWQEGFVRNIEKLLPNVYPSEYGKARSSASGPRLLALSANHKPTRAQRKYASPAECVKQTARDAARRGSREANAGPPNQLRSARNPSVPSRSTAWISNHTSSSRTRIANPESASGRVLRGDPIPDYHAGTYIPPSPTVSRKPEAPSEESHGPASHFTDADKIFFIKYLRWRLRDIERLPSKLTLLEELAKETPHHDAEAWHKHWDGNWELPDQIYIAARKRLQACGSSDSDSLTSLSEAESSDNGDDETDGNSSPNYDDVSSASADAGHGRAGRGGGCGVKVTDDDRRAMALYLVEKRCGALTDCTRNFALWKEFARRPENQKRTDFGWNSAARGHAREILMYYEEYIKTTATRSDTAIEARETGLPEGPVAPQAAAPALPESLVANAIHAVRRTEEIPQDDDEKTPVSKKRSAAEAQEEHAVLSRCAVRADSQLDDESKRRKVESPGVILDSD